jgi:hypothetical protein
MLASSGLPVGKTSTNGSKYIEIPGIITRRERNSL